MKTRAVLAPLAAVLLAGAALAPVHAATDLLQAWQLARRADPALAAADANRRAIDEGVVQARAPLLPQLGASAGWNQQTSGALDPDGRLRTRDVSLNLSQTLVDVGAVARLGAARSLSDAQAAAYLAAEQDLCVRVASAYLDALSAADELAIAQANEDAYRRQAEQAESRYRSGLSAQVDVEQARAYHANARGRTIDARTALADAREALAEITGAPVDELKPLRAELALAAPQPDDASAWVAMALAQNPALAVQSRTVDAAQRTIDAQRAGHLPTLSAGLGVGRSTQWPSGGAIDPGPLNGRSVTSVGLTLNIPLYSGGAVDSRVRQAAAQRDAARDDLEARRRRLARDTLEQFRGVHAGIGQIEAARLAVASAAKALESTRVGLELGTQTMTDLLLAIQTQSAALEAQSQARHRYLVARLRLAQSAGAIGESDLASVNAMLD